MGREQIVKEEYLISVIIPCYNAEKNIDKTLSSLEDQTYKNFQVIIINDGSTDKTDFIIKKYLSKSSLNYEYICKENSGVSSSRNLGINISKGKYITFLDSDDIYNYKYIESLYNMLISKNVDTVYCCYSRDIDKVMSIKQNNDMNKSKYLTHKELMKSFMYRKGPCAFWSFIYKKSIIDKYKIKFTEKFKYGEDLEFTWKYLTHCKDGIFIDEELYGYRDNPESAINNISWRITDVIKAIKSVELYMEHNREPFLEQFKNYMYHRTIWSVAKDFSQNGNKELFEKFTNEYNVKKSMRIMLKQSSNILIRLSSLLYCINKKYFYCILSKL